MTSDEFQRRYHKYKTRDSQAARAEAMLVNQQADGFVVVAVRFGSLGYGLMLREAAEVVKDFEGIEILETADP